MIRAVSLATADQRSPVSPPVRPAEADAPYANPRRRFSASHKGMVGIVGIVGMVGMVGMVANFWAEGAV